MITPKMSKHRIIAINLPQYHPFPENDKWWGKGFTEWTNVTKAKPRFPGHYQPQLPTDTGYYDLRLPETRKMQADMARNAGIYGFCYYHYWFNGHRLMERPVNEILSSGEPDFPFMFCWANENWSRNWDGGYSEILIKQEYSAEDDINHMTYLCKEVFTDKRYIKVNGKPFFVIYRPSLLPDIATTIKTWREVAASFGLELYLGYMRGWDVSDAELMQYDFDVHVDFQPNLFGYGKPHEYFKGPISWFNFCMKNKICEFLTGKSVYKNENLFDYREIIENRLNRRVPAYKEFPCVSPGWDNSSRRVNRTFHAIVNNTPELYSYWIENEMIKFSPYSVEENFIFINAWNEWAEGNHLEPDQRWSTRFLEATRTAISKDV